MNKMDRVPVFMEFMVYQDRQMFNNHVHFSHLCTTKNGVVLCHFGVLFYCERHGRIFIVFFNAYVSFKGFIQLCLVFSGLYEEPYQHESLFWGKIKKYK